MNQTKLLNSNDMDRLRSLMDLETTLLETIRLLVTVDDLVIDRAFITLVTNYCVTARNQLHSIISTF